LIIENYVFLAHIGQNRGVVTYTDSAGTVEYTITHEHNTDNIDEEARIKELGWNP